MAEAVKEAYTYSAFISYRHRELDTAVAKAIHRELETYRVPVYLQKQTGRRGMGKVFRDQDELPLLADLGEGIRLALEHSEWLIVICSPDLPLSKWCMAEIDTFIALGRRDRILPVLIAGEPEGSFPPQLRFVAGADGSVTEREPLAADVRAGSMAETLKKVKREKLRLLAPMLGVGYDDLRRRQRERTLRRALGASVAAAVFFALFGGYALRQAAVISRQNREITAALNEVYTSQSKIYANYSAEQLSYGDRAGAVLLALEGLPQNPAAPERPVVPEAAAALYNAVYNSSGQAYEPLVQLAGDDNLVLSPDGGTFVVTQDAKVRIYDTATLRLIAEKPGATTAVAVYHSPATGMEAAQVKRPVYNSDGSRVLLPNGVPSVMDTRTGETVYSGYFTGAAELAEFRLPRYVLTYPTYDEGKVLMDAVSGEALFDVPADYDTSTYRISPDGRYLLYADYKKLDVYDIGTRQLVYTVPCEGLFVVGGYTFFSPDSRHFVLTRRQQGQREVGDGSTDYESIFLLEVRETATGRLIYESAMNTRSAYPANYYHTSDADLCGLLFSPDGERLIMPLAGGEYGLLDLAGGEVGVKLSVSSFQFAAFSADGGSIIICNNTSSYSNLWVLDAYTGERLASAYMPDFSFRRAYMAQGGSLLVAGYNSATKENVCQILRPAARGDDESVAAYFPDGCGNAVVGGEGDYTIKNLATGELLAVLEGSALYGSFATDGSIVAAQSMGHIAVWDAATGARRFAAERLTSRLYDVYISPDGVIGTMYQQYGVVAGGFCTYDAAGELLADVHLGATDSAHMLFDPTLHRFAFIRAGTVQLYNARTGELVAEFTDYPTGELMLANYRGFTASFSPGGDMLAVSHEKKQTVEIIDCATGKRVHELTTGGGSAVALAFSHGGGHIAVATSAGLLEAYEVGRGTQVFSVYEPDGLSEICYTVDDMHIMANGIHSALTGEKTGHYLPPTRYLFEVDMAGGELYFVDAGRVKRIPPLAEAASDARALLGDYGFTPEDRLKYSIG